MPETPRSGGRSGRTNGYQLLELELSPAVEDRVVGELWAAGTLGLESRTSADGGLRIVAYFEEATQAAACIDRLTGRGGEVVLRRNDRQPDTDWLAAYRRSARPFPLGHRLTVDPGEPSGAAVGGAGRRLLRIPARRAFGTGEHASTRLVIEVLETLDLAGRSVLDLGSGSGVLSFAAALWGARRVVAVELDPVAAFTARENQALNGVAFPQVVGRAAALGAGAGFDLALVNVLPENLRPDLDDLRDLLRVGGRAIFSGILTDLAAASVTRLAAHGFTTLERRELAEWTALVTTTAGDHPRREALGA